MSTMKRKIDSLMDALDGVSLSTQRHPRKRACREFVRTKATAEDPFDLGQPDIPENCTRDTIVHIINQRERKLKALFLEFLSKRQSNDSTFNIHSPSWVK